MALRTMFAARVIAQAVGGVIEMMEPRRMLSSIVQHAGGRLEITGSNADNQIHVTQSGKLINVEIDGVVRSFPAKKIDRLMIHALGGNDTIVNDTDLPAKLEGGLGDDRLVGGSDRDRFIGGDGTDTADYSARTGALSLTLDGQCNDGQTNERDKLQDDIEILIGGSGDDRLVGNDLNNTLLGNAGADTMIAGLGNDFLNGDVGNDLYDYSTRTEVITGRFDATVNASGRVTIGAESDLIGDDLEYRFLSGSGNDDLLAGTSQPAGQVRHYLDIDGGGGNDTLVASGFESITEVTLRGGDGDDNFHSGTDSSPSTIMFGDAGNDFCERPGVYPFAGGDGDDTISYYEDYSRDIDLRTMDGTENLILRNGSLVGTVFGTDGPNRIELLPGAYAKAIFGLGGNDTLQGGDNFDYIDGGEGNDCIAGNDGNDTLIGGEGDDYLDGGAGDDSITGGNGDDTIVAGLGNDVLNGEAGNDLYDYSARTEAITGRFSAALQSGKITIGTEFDQIFDGLEYRFLSGSGADDLRVNISSFSGQPAHRLVIDGGVGDDNLQVGASEMSTDVTMHGGDGNDTFSVGPDSGITPVCFGDAGNDFCSLLNPSPFYGGDGNDTLRYRADNGRDVDLRTMQGTENLILRSGSSVGTVYGTDADNVITLEGAAFAAGGVHGLGGNDILTGGITRDTLDGGEGNDTITGAGWYDVLIGGPGDDVFFNFDPTVTLSVNFPSMSDTIDGGDGNDTAQIDPLDVMTNVENVV